MKRQGSDILRRPARNCRSRIAVTRQQSLPFGVSLFERTASWAAGLIPQGTVKSASVELGSGKELWSLDIEAFRGAKVG